MHVALRPHRSFNLEHRSRRTQCKNFQNQGVLGASSALDGAMSIDEWM
jgi:hypothetical protein